MNLTANELALVCAATLGNAAKYVNWVNRYTDEAMINTPARASMFFGQVSAESGRLSTVEENLSYSAKRMTQVWPSRFPTIESAKPYEFNPQALANKTYGGRLGNTQPNDGWWFRGRGLKQLTGRSNYKRMSTMLGQDFMTKPELVATPQWAVATAVQFWRDIGGNVYADKGDYIGLTKAINGGLIGYDIRVDLRQHAEAKLAHLVQVAQANGNPSIYA